MHIPITSTAPVRPGLTPALPGATEKGKQLTYFSIHTNTPAEAGVFVIMSYRIIVLRHTMTGYLCANRMNMAATCARVAFACGARL